MPRPWHECGSLDEFQVSGFRLTVCVSSYSSFFKAILASTWKRRMDTPIEQQWLVHVCGAVWCLLWSWFCIALSKLSSTVMFELFIPFVSSLTFFPCTFSCTVVQPRLLPCSTLSHKSALVCSCKCFVNTSSGLSLRDLFNYRCLFLPVQPSPHCCLFYLTALYSDSLLQPCARRQLHDAACTAAMRTASADESATVFCVLDPLFKQCDPRTMTPSLVNLALRLHLTQSEPFCATGFPFLVIHTSTPLLKHVSNTWSTF